MGRIQNPGKSQISQYDPGFIPLLIDYFEGSANAPTRELEPIVTTEEGSDSKGDKKSVKREVRRICAELPTFEGFAGTIGFSAQTVWSWRASFPEWAEACARAKDIQKRLLIDRGLTRQYDPSAFQFVAMNVTDMRPGAMLDGILSQMAAGVKVTIETVGTPLPPADPPTFDAEPDK
jgi:hypothetical protein